VISFLKSKLPNYMLPSAFAFLDELPRTPNGKVDRRALPVPEPARLAPKESFVAPRNQLERQIAGIWTSIMGVRPIGVKDNFFDLGGYSLLAVRVMSQIEKVLGKKLPVTALFQMPTVEQLARLVRQEVSLAPWSSLVPLQPNGAKAPFFWVHGDASDAILSRYLGTDQPLYGLLHQSHDGKPARFTSVEDIAAHYLSEIRTVQAKGPYFIGGYCFGGLLAFEIAQQLKTQDEKVALLALVDPSRLRNDRFSDRVHGDTGLLSNKRTSFRHELSRLLRNVERWSARKRACYVFERIKRKLGEVFAKLSGPVRRLAQTTACRVYLWGGLPIPPALRSSYLLKVYFRAIGGYEPKAYPGRVIIFRATPRWRTVVDRGTTFHEMPGSHTDILKEPHIRVWAEGLKSHLEEVQAATEAHPPVVPHLPQV
jgi:aspartate racemase